MDECSLCKLRAGLKYDDKCHFHRTIDSLREEMEHYRKALDDIAGVCGTSQRGHFKRGLGNDVLSLAFDALSFRERKSILVVSEEK